jgi:hypothetical protein
MVAEAKTDTVVALNDPKSLGHRVWRRHAVFGLSAGVRTYHPREMDRVGGVYDRHMGFSARLWRRLGDIGERVPHATDAEWVVRSRLRRWQAVVLRSDGGDAESAMARRSEGASRVSVDKTHAEPVTAELRFDDGSETSHRLSNGAPAAEATAPEGTAASVGTVHEGEQSRVRASGRLTTSLPSFARRLASPPGSHSRDTDRGLGCVLRSSGEGVRGTSPARSLPVISAAARAHGPQPSVIGQRWTPVWDTTGAMAKPTQRHLSLSQIGRAPGIRSRLQQDLRVDAASVLRSSADSRVLVSLREALRSETAWRFAPIPSVRPNDMLGKEGDEAGGAFVGRVTSSDNNGLETPIARTAAPGSVSPAMLMRARNTLSRSMSRSLPAGDGGRFVPAVRLASVAHHMQAAAAPAHGGGWSIVRPRANASGPYAGDVRVAIKGQAGIEPGMHEHHDSVPGQADLPIIERMAPEGGEPPGDVEVFMAAGVERALQRQETFAPLTNATATLFARPIGPPSLVVSRPRLSTTAELGPSRLGEFTINLYPHRPAVSPSFVRPGLALSAAAGRLRDEGPVTDQSARSVVDPIEGAPLALRLAVGEGSSPAHSAAAAALPLPRAPAGASTGFDQWVQGISATESVPASQTRDEASAGAPLDGDHDNLAGKVLMSPERAGRAERFGWPEKPGDLIAARRAAHTSLPLISAAPFWPTRASANRGSVGVVLSAQTSPAPLSRRLAPGSKSQPRVATWISGLGAVQPILLLRPFVPRASADPDPVVSLSRHLSAPRPDARSPRHDLARSRAMASMQLPMPLALSDWSVLGRAAGRPGQGALMGLSPAPSRTIFPSPHGDEQWAQAWQHEWDSADLPVVAQGGGLVPEGLAGAEVSGANGAARGGIGTVRVIASDTLPSNSTATRRLGRRRLEPMVRQPRRGFDSRIAGQVHAFPMAVDRAAGGGVLLRLTAAFSANDVPAHIDGNALVPSASSSAGVSNFPVVVRRVVERASTTAGDRPDTAVGGADQPEAIYGVVPGASAGRAEPPAASRTSADVDGRSNRSDPEEVGERAWQTVMDRLAVEQERRGFARWP